MWVNCHIHVYFRSFYKQQALLNAGNIRLSYVHVHVKSPPIGTRRIDGLAGASVAELSEAVAEPTQRAFGAKMTSDQRRCDVITSHRRLYDVILVPNARWASVINLRVVNVLRNQRQRFVIAETYNHNSTSTALRTCMIFFTYEMQYQEQ